MATRTPMLARLSPEAVWGPRRSGTSSRLPVVALPRLQPRTISIGTRCSSSAEVPVRARAGMAAAAAGTILREGGEGPVGRGGVQCSLQGRSGGAAAGLGLHHFPERVCDVIRRVSIEPLRAQEKAHLLQLLKAKNGVAVSMSCAPGAQASRNADNRTTLSPAVASPYIAARRPHSGAPRPSAPTAASISVLTATAISLADWPSRADLRRRRVCHSAAPPSAFSGCFNTDGERASAK